MRWGWLIAIMLVLAGCGPHVVKDDGLYVSLPKEGDALAVLAGTDAPRLIYPTAGGPWEMRLLTDRRVLGE